MSKEVRLYTLSLVAVVACGGSASGGENETGDGSSGGSGASSSGSVVTTGGTEAESSGAPASSGSSSGAVDSSGSSTGDTAVDCTRSDLRPSARSEIDGVWDAPRGRMVFFGGDQGTPASGMSQTDFVGETWAFRTDCDEFDQLAEGSDGPPPRGRYAVAHDVAGARMFIHGGRYRASTSGTYTLYDDTWAFDLATDTWSQIDAVGPSPRTNHTAVVAGTKLLVFGGNASNNGLAFTPLDDLWVLDLETETWDELPNAGAPDARLFHSAAISDDGGTMFIYGGGDESAFTGPFFADFWAYDIADGTWTELGTDSSTTPIGSIWGDLVFDGAHDQLLLWGAHEDNLLGNDNKLWSFDLAGGQWTLLVEGDVLQAEPAGFCDFPVDFVDPDLTAPERRSAGAGVLTDAGELVVFGGKTDCGIIDDVWSWSLADATWTNRIRATTGEICVRAFADGCTTMCF